MKKAIILRLGLLIVSSIVLCNLTTGTPAWAKVIKWKMELTYPSNTKIGAFQASWGKGITKLSGGRLQIDVIEPGAVVPVKELFQAVSTGVIQAAGAFGGFYTGIMPEGDVEMGLIFAWQNNFEIHDAFYHRGLADELRKIYAEHNIYYVCPCYSGGIYGWALTKPVRKPEDFKGLKIRALGLGAEFVKHYGASATVMSAGDLYMALKLGTIDGAHYGPTCLEDLKLGEVCKYYLLEPNGGCIDANILVNKDAWKALPEDLKEMINYFSLGIILQNMYSEWIPWLKSSKKYGVEGIRWSRKDIADVEAYAMDVLWEKIANKSPRCRKLVEMVKEQAAFLGRGKHK